MIKSLILITLIFYFLAIIQFSFLPHFGKAGIFLNLILISIFLINFFEKKEKKFGIYSALIGGFFLDIFSNNFIGFYILICFAFSIFLKKVFKKYVRIPIGT